MAKGGALMLPLDTIAVIVVIFVVAIGVSLMFDSWVMGWIVRYFGGQDE